VLLVLRAATACADLMAALVIAPLSWKIQELLQTMKKLLWIMKTKEVVLMALLCKIKLWRVWRMRPGCSVVGLLSAVLSLVLQLSVVSQWLAGPPLLGA